MRTAFTILLVGALLAGCQSYSPLPLDDAAHARDWQARDISGSAVREYAAALAKRDATARSIYDPKDGLDLAEAEVVALFFNARLRKARLDAGAALAGAQNAGEWDNPELNISAGLILDSIANPWTASAGLEFTIPISGRKGVEKDLAFAQHHVKFREVLALEWEVIGELRAAWRERAATAERVALLREHIASMEDVNKRADELTKAGELQRTEARVFAIELIVSRIDLAEQERMGDEQDTALKGMLGLLPAAPVKLNTALAAGSAATGDLKNSPQLELMRAEYAVAEQNLRLEIRKQYPDLRIGPGYDIDEGQSTISLGFGIPIPIINLNRQGIAQARGERLAARAAYEGAVEELTVRQQIARQRLARVNSTRRAVEEQLAPLVDLQVKEANDRAKAGDFDALLTLEALKSRLEAKERVLQTKLEEAMAIDALNALAGPTFKPEEERK
jgi:outer membrane protein TolC